jgi:hypothetical protein
MPSEKGSAERIFERMSTTKQLQSGDIPQADTLKTVRQVISQVASGNKSVAGISEVTGVSERHVQYRMQTGRILSLLDAENSITPLGKKLLQTTEGAADEIAFWQRAISACPAVKILVPNLFGKNEIVRNELAARIESLTGMSPETAKRRMTVFCAWRRQLMPPKESS